MPKKKKVINEKINENSSTPDIKAEIKPDTDQEEAVAFSTKTITDKDESSKKKKSKGKIIFLTIIGLLIIGLVIIYYFFSNNLDKIIANNNTSLYKQLQLMAQNSDKPLKGEQEDRINILLLGIGGGNHDGANLTDTIIIASVKPSTNEVALISVPRDLAVIMDKEGQRINKIYEMAGINTMIAKVEEVTGQTIHYYVLLDFEGFMKIIDDIGGINVDVPANFNGYYHITDCGGTCSGADGGPTYLGKKKQDGPYCLFKFTAGLKKMKGEEALRFSRIRKVAKGSAAEGTDFARARRQQKVLEAFQKKILSTTTLINPIKITSVLNDVGENLQTNMELWEMAKLAILAENINSEKIYNKVIDEAGGLIKGSTSPLGGYFLDPVIGSYKFSEIQKYCADVFDNSSQNSNVNTLDTNTNSNANSNTSLKKENAIIFILNGTTINGLAATRAEALEKLKYNVSKIANAPQQTETKTLLFDITNNNPQTKAALLKELNAIEANIDFSKKYSLTNANKIDYNPEEADFIIVLGQNQE